MVLRVADARNEDDLELAGATCLLERDTPPDAGRPGVSLVGRAYVYEQRGTVLLQKLGSADAIRINDRPVGHGPCQLFDQDILQVGACTWRVIGDVGRDSTGATEIYHYPDEQLSDTGTMDSESVGLEGTRVAHSDGEPATATAIAPSAAQIEDETRLMAPAADERDTTRLLPGEEVRQGDTGGDATRMDRDAGPLCAAPEATRLSADCGEDIGATVLDDGHAALTAVQYEGRAKEYVGTRVRAPVAGSGDRQRRRFSWWLVIAGLMPAMIYITWLVVQANLSPQRAPRPLALDLVGEYLASGQLAALPAQLLRINRAQPTDAEARRLLEDANRLQDLLYLRDTRQWRDFAALRDRSFNTDLFEQTARHRVDREVMGVGSLRRYNQAADAWREGQLVDALNGMRALARGASESAAVETLSHYRGVIEGSHALAALRSDPRYGAVLVEHYLGLDPVEDAFYWSRLPADLAAANPPLAADAGEVLTELAELWRSYRGSGGIPSALRQQAGRSETFRQRAAELEGACQALARLADLPSLVGEPVALNSLYLARRLRSELTYQRDRLLSLLAVNEEPTLRQRLQSLPFAPGCRDA